MWSSAGPDQHLEAGKELMQRMRSRGWNEIDQKRHIAGVGGGAMWRNKTVTIGRASEREKGIKEWARCSVPVF
jgi:hypothetical protein